MLFIWRDYLTFLARARAAGLSPLHCVLQVFAVVSTRAYEALMLPLGSNCLGWHVLVTDSCLADSATRLFQVG